MLARQLVEMSERNWTNTGKIQASLILGVGGVVLIALTAIMAAIDQHYARMIERDLMNPDSAATGASALNPAAVIAFQADLRSYADTLSANFAVASQVKGQPEDQLKGPVSMLIAAAGAALGLQVVTRTEVRVSGVTGRPDLGVAVGGLLTGNVELKAPGKGADAHLFGHKRDRDQFERFSALPNLAYSDGRIWTLYASGQQIARAELPFNPTQPATNVTATAAAQLLASGFHHS